MRQYSYSVNHLHRGFTLLELLVVIGLLGIVALAATTFIVEDKGFEFQDATEKRWNQIRYAIIGDTSRTLNNEPMVSGYVADMGRLPANLQELTTQGAQPGWTSIQLSTINPGVTVGSLSGGWRGPYLYRAGSAFFRDGWGNEDAVVANDAINFGWQVSHTPVSAPACTTVPDCTDLQVQSLGRDNAASGAEFSEDFPASGTNIVNANDWQLTGATINFNVVFNKPPSAGQDVELHIYFFEDNAVQEETSTAPFNLPAVDTTPNTKSVSLNGPLPMGKYAVVVWCPAPNNRVYNGDCTVANTKQPYYFTLLPSAIPPITIPWNIP